MISRITEKELLPFIVRMQGLHRTSEGRVPRMPPEAIKWHWVDGWIGSLLKAFGIIGIYEKFSNRIFIPLGSVHEKALLFDEKMLDASFVHELGHAVDRRDFGIVWMIFNMRKSEENALRDECRARHFNKTWGTMTAED